MEDYLKNICRSAVCLQMVQKQLKKTKNDKRKEKLHFLLKRMVRTQVERMIHCNIWQPNPCVRMCVCVRSQENQERAKKNRDQQRERELQFRKEQREQANHGAKPFFLKNCKNIYSLYSVSPSHCCVPISSYSSSLRNQINLYLYTLCYNENCF